MKRQRSPLVPALIGVVLLAFGVMISISFIRSTAEKTFTPLAMSKAIGLSVVVLVVAVLFLSIAIGWVGPRRRYLAATTPEQRRTIDAADRVQRRAARIQAPGTPMDYGTRLDGAPDGNPDGESVNGQQDTPQ